MLDFYGLKLCNEQTGEVERAENWKERFYHLNHSMHNYLCITRILKCLGEMELEHLKALFVRYVLHEIISEQTLYNCLNSCINYWLQVGTKNHYVHLGDNSISYNVNCLGQKLLTVVAY